MAAAGELRGSIMTIWRGLFAHLILAGWFAASVAAVPTPSRAGVEPMPELGSVCLQERVVLRPKGGQDIDDAAVSEGIALVRETICDRARPACFDAGMEVAMALCRP